MFRYTFYYQNYNQGWSETFFRGTQFGTGEGNILENYVINRLQLLSTRCSLVGIRSSNLDSKRDVTIYNVPLAGRGGTWVLDRVQPDGRVAGTETESEDSFTALLLRLTDGNQHYRTFPLLGMPDHVLSGGVVRPDEEALVRARLNGWMGAITQASFGMKLQIAPALSGRIVTFPDKTQDNQLVCLGLSGAAPAQGTLITLGGVKPWRQLNRTWRVASTAPGDVNAASYIYLTRSAGVNTFGPVEGGTYKTPVYSLAVLNAYTISRLTVRKTGVPFGTVRGRRSK